MPRPFLTCEWKNLFLATYVVPPALLKPYLPAGLELDTRNGDAFVSLVAFEFLRLSPQFPLVRRILPVTAVGNFPELNLRYYVHQGGDRGVVFLREIVSPRLVAWTARLIYNEPYRVASLTSRCQEDQTSRTMEYRLSWGGRDQVLWVCGSKPAFLPGPNSDEHFFKEHYWGFGRTRRGEALRYHVKHPPWEVFPVVSYHVEMDWASVYGPQWGFLSKATPISTVFAIGSAVEVYPKGRLTQNGKSTGVSG